MIQAWRIVHEDYLSCAFDGEGARQTGGRWNSEGVRAVYTAGSLSLALLETLVRLEIRETLNYFKAVPVSFDESGVLTVAGSELPGHWNRTPPGFTTKAIGDRWIRDELFPVLCVPSAVVPQEKNYLLNPQHPDFGNITIGPPIALPVDPRFGAFFSEKPKAAEPQPKSECCGITP
jgi:RES domain-containing protein